MEFTVPVSTWAPYDVLTRWTGKNPVDHDTGLFLPIEQAGAVGFW